MGCCSSQPAEDGADPHSINDGGRRVTERTPLLKDQQRGRHHSNSVAPQTTYGGGQQAIQDREREAMLAVVQKTADLLINVHPGDPVGSKIVSRTVSERSSSYQRATQSLRLKKKKSATSQHANIAALLDEASISVADRELVSAAAQRISSAVSSMTIANVGPLIQSLPEL